MSSPRIELAHRLMVAGWNAANHLATEPEWSSDTPDNIYETMVDNRLMDNKGPDDRARFVVSVPAARLCDSFMVDVDELLTAAKAVVAGNGDIGRLNAAVKRMEEEP